MDHDDPRHGTRDGYRVMRCRCDRCRRSVALQQNLYAMRRAANGGEPLTVPKIGTVRRIRALMALGWPRRTLSKEAGYRGDALALILSSPRERVTLATHDRVVDLYDRLSGTPGPSALSRMRAQRTGEPTPLAWEGVDIDDPVATPDPGRQRTNWRSAELVEEWDHLRRCGVGIEEAARRLGITVDAIEKAVERARKEVA